MATRRRGWPQPCRRRWRVLGTTRVAGEGGGDARGGGRAGGLGGRRRGRRGDRGGGPPAGLAAAGRGRRPGAGAARARRCAAARPAWVGYLSTTGVYGDRQGGWVDEDERARAGQRARPLAGGGGARPGSATGLPVQVFRLAGIYGPGRSAFDRLREGRAQRIVKPGQVFSRIHVDDIAAVLRGVDGAAAARGASTTSPTTSRRRRRTWSRYAARAARAAGAAGDPVRGGGALADGAQLLRRVEAGRRTGGSRRSSAWRSPIPTTGRGCARSWPPGG